MNINGAGDTYAMATTVHAAKNGDMQAVGGLATTATATVASLVTPVKARAKLFSPKPITPKKVKLRGAANPKVRAAIEAGNRAHKDIQGKASKKGWGVEVPMTDPKTGKPVRADLVTPGGSPIEIKPNTSSGRAKGKKQLPQYERATGERGRVIYYDPEKYKKN